MSLATLKTKSLTLYGKSHSTKDGFSLNGVYRHPSLGENLGRSVTRTPFRGPAPRGHGCGGRCRVSGRKARLCGGTYPIRVVRSCLGTTQTTVKPSTLSMKGLLETKYKGILHGVYPNTHVYRAEYTNYAENLGRSVLSTTNTALEKNVDNTSCIYVKTILGMDYNRYHKIYASSCSIANEPYKGINGYGLSP
jgi:hypothetical protein